MSDATVFLVAVAAGASAVVALSAVVAQYLDRREHERRGW